MDLLRTPFHLPYYRMVGYVTTILMHSANVYVMMNGFRGDAMDDPKIRQFATFQEKFITCWTFAAQSSHAVLGLSCDLLTLLMGDQQEIKFLKFMKQTKNILFASIVVPYTLMIPTAFWPLFLYDRELVLPVFTTKIINNLSNQIMHTAIIPATLWEMVFQRRESPSSHLQNILLMFGFTACYLIVIFVSFFETGVFPYPLMTMLYEMPPPIYFRIFGYVTTLAMHSINAFVMLTSLQNDIIMKDPEIRTMASMQGRFLTVWNIAFQMTYAGLGLTCDVLTLINREHLLPKNIEKLRDFFFSTIVFPGTVLVFAFFWPFYLYDRNIIFPEFIDKVFSQKSNYIMHLAIVPVVFWELAFQPRNRPKSHVPYLVVIFLYYIVYNGFLLYTYQQRGLWPYPLMGIIYGTIYNVVLHVCSIIVGLFIYFIQWPLSSFFWGKESPSSEKIKLK